VTGISPREFFQAERDRVIGRAARAFCVALLPLALSAAGADAPAARLSLTIADIDSPWFSARGLHAALRGPELSRLELGVDVLTVQGRTWRGVRLDCPDFLLEKDVLRCRSGSLRGAETVPVKFSYSFSGPSFEVEIEPAAGEKWTLSGRPAGGAWEGVFSVTAGQAARLAPWLPAAWPRPAAGVLDFNTRLAWQRGEPVSLVTTLAFRGLGFSDQAGTHAGEKLAGRVSLDSRFSAGQWVWSGTFGWEAGELFWQPVYLAQAGVSVAASGRLDPGTLRVTEGRIESQRVGAATFSAVVATAPQAIQSLEISAPNLDLGALFERVVRPFMGKTQLADVNVTGRGGVNLSMDQVGLRRLDITLSDAAISDGRGQLHLDGIVAAIPWSRQEHTIGSARLAGGQVLGIALGEIGIPIELEGGRFAVPRVELPIVDGRLTIEGLQGMVEQSGSSWEFHGGLSAVSMEALTRGLGIHVMHGNLSGVIPRLRYARSTLELDGELLIQAFDGTTVIHKLVLEEPLGRAPRLAAEIDMRNIDLDLLTRTFSFGSMQGRVDVTVRGLELSNWQPVSFDARLVSSPGDYPRRISQAAVQNISALGGPGAAAAIQRSVVGVFKEFGYSKIGLSCKLERGVCHMGGVEDAPQGYVIVKGGGIPALTVMGYNRSVGWNELITRLQRITRDNVSPVIQ
jgi:hypothetical protein